MLGTGRSGYYKKKAEDGVELLTDYETSQRKSMGTVYQNDDEAFNLEK
jgi:hypothetical protein